MNENLTFAFLCFAGSCIGSLVMFERTKRKIYLLIFRVFVCFAATAGIIALGISIYNLVTWTDSDYYGEVTDIYIRVTKPFNK